MLTAGSAYVQQIHQTQGKEIARAYVNQAAQVVCNRVQKHLSLKKRQEQQLEW
jgi:hypothetical protein